MKHREETFIYGPGERAAVQLLHDWPAEKVPRIKIVAQMGIYEAGLRQVRGADWNAFYGAGVQRQNQILRSGTIKTKSKGTARSRNTGSLLRKLERVGAIRRAGSSAVIVLDRALLGRLLKGETIPWEGRT